MIRATGYSNKNFILVRQDTKQPVEKGSEFPTFRGEQVRLVSAAPPHKESSTGRVYVEDPDGGRHEFFPSVIDLQWVEEVL